MHQCRTTYKYWSRARIWKWNNHQTGTYLYKRPWTN